MVWFKVDDSFHSHPKVLATEPAALGLWVVAGSWCGDNLSNGLVPLHVLPRLLPDAATLAETLVTAGLWKRTRGGYQFHQWGDWQPSKDEVLGQRRRNALRQALFRDPGLRDKVRRRDQDLCRYCGTKVKWTDRRSGEGGTYDHVDPREVNEAENVVVSCRGCATQKAGRTPQRAGMTLLPPGTMAAHVPKSEPVTRPVSSPLPTRPPLKGGGARRAPSARPPTCPKHLGQPAHNCAICRSDKLGKP